MKKILALVLALTLALGTFSFAAAAPEDVVGTDYEDAVGKLTYLGIIAGFPDGTYRPGEPVTRAQFAKIIVTALGVGEAAQYAAGTTKFADVPADHWATGYINVAADLGIIVGYPDGTFAPENQVSYAEAIKMIVAALGYTPKAEQMGGYPGGYLAIAAEKEISDGVTVINNMAANRGDIALMIDNALTVPMMVQKTWGQYPEYGEDEDQTLMKKLGVDEIEGRVVAIPRVDSKLDDNEIRLGEAEDKDDNGVYEVIEGVDVEAAFGNEATLYVKKDKVLGITVESDYFIDAIDVADDGTELELVQEDEEYDISEDVVVWVNGKSAKNLVDAEYAKVVLDDDDEVIFVDAYNFDFIVVEEVDDEIIFGYGDELDAEDYVFVKDGKAIALEDLEEGDIVFYNSKAEFAVVYNASFVGEIEKIYEDEDEESELCTIKVDGEEIDVVGRTAYLDDDELAAFTVGVAEDMMDAEGEVTVFVDMFGDAVFVLGDTGEADTSKFYALVLENTDDWDGREKFWTLDVLSETGKELNYDIPDSDKIDTDFFTAEDEGKDWDDIIAGAVVEIEVDEDGEVKSVTLLEIDGEDYDNTKVYFETDDSYVEGMKLQDSAVVFDVEDDLSEGAGYDPLSINGDADDIEVSTFGELSYDKIYTAVVYKDNKDRVAVIVVTSSDREGDTTAYDAVATGAAVKVAGEYTYRLKLSIDGEKGTYYTKEFKSAKTDIAGIKKYDFMEVEIDDDTGEINVVNNVYARVVEGVEIADLSVSSDKFVGDDNETYRLSDAVLLDKDLDPIRISSLSEGDKVDVLLVEADSTYVSILVVRAEADEGEEEPPEVETMEFGGAGLLDGNVYVTLDGELYPYAGSATATDLNSDFEEGEDVIVTFATIRDEVVVIKIEKVKEE
jgi:hypothetical protein